MNKIKIKGDRAERINQNLLYINVTSLFTGVCPRSETISIKLINNYKSDYRFQVIEDRHGYTIDFDLNAMDETFVTPDEVDNEITSVDTLSKKLNKCIKYISKSYERAYRLRDKLNEKCSQRSIDKTLTVDTFNSLINKE